MQMEACETFSSAELWARQTQDQERVQSTSWMSKDIFHTVSSEEEEGRLSQQEGNE